MSPFSRRARARAGLALFIGAGCTFLRASPAEAGEIQVASGPGGYASSWRGDGSFGEALRLGYRFADLVAIDTVGRLGYGTVDQRMITYLSLGGTVYGRLGKVRPSLRLAFVHQHEEPAPGVRADPWGTVFGVGDGIRHRAGGSASLGLEIPVERTKSGVEITVGLAADGVWLPDPKGPPIYAGGSLWLGLSFGS